MPVLGTHARATVRQTVCALLDGMPIPASRTVTVRAAYGERKLHPHQSRCGHIPGVRYPGAWYYMAVNNPGPVTEVRVWMTTQGGERDEVRDIILAVLRERGWTTEQHPDDPEHFFRRAPEGWSPNFGRNLADEVGLHMSSSMRTKLREWASRDGCRVSTMFYSQHYAGGAPTSPFVSPLPGNYLTIRDDGNISYLPRGRYEEAEQPWRPSTGRQDARPARFVRQLFTKQALAALTDKDWEAFASRIKGVATAERVTIERVTGEDIRTWYHEDRMHRNRQLGDLANSCMRYHTCQPYFDVYVRNPDQISMLIARDGDGLLGRTILWETEDGETVHDRIYGSEGTRSAMLDWCADNGIRRARSGDSVQLANPWYRKYPYFDTFHYITPDGRMPTSDHEDHAISHGGTSGGTDLRDGVQRCAGCNAVTGWRFYGPPDTCNDCRERIERERLAGVLEQYRTSPPEAMTFGDYLGLDRRMFEMVHEGGTGYLIIRDLDDRSELCRYQYHPEAYSGNTETGNLFTLMPVAAAV